MGVASCAGWALTFSVVTASITSANLAGAAFALSSSLRRFVGDVDNQPVGVELRPPAAFQALRGGSMCTESPASRRRGVGSRRWRATLDPSARFASRASCSAYRRRRGNPSLAALSLCRPISAANHRVGGRGDSGALIGVDGCGGGSLPRRRVRRCLLAHRRRLLRPAGHLLHPGSRHIPNQSPRAAGPEPAAAGGGGGGPLLDASGTAAAASASAASSFRRGRGVFTTELLRRHGSRRAVLRRHVVPHVPHTSDDEGLGLLILASPPSWWGLSRVEPDRSTALTHR